MNSIPVDTSRITTLVGGAIEPALTPSGTQRQSRDGKPLFNVPVVALIEGDNPDTFTVRVPGPVVQIPQLTPVRLIGLVARPWQMEGRSGVSFSASAIQPVQPGTGQNRS